MILGLAIHAQNCITDVLPVGEKDLLDPDKRWPTTTLVTDSMRSVFLTSFGFSDSTGTVSDEISLRQITTCNYPFSQSDQLQLTAFLINGIEGDRDISVWLAVTNQTHVVSRTLLAQLQTTCTATYLRAASLEIDGSVRIQQLQHNFECGTDEFKGTEHLPTYTIEFGADGSITDVLPNNFENSNTESDSEK